MQDITLITGNLDKVAEFSRLLGFEVNHVKLDLPEIQTTSVREVVTDKAEEAYRQIGRPVMVDDTGLTIKAWGDLPGALCKFFLYNDKVGVAGTVKMLGDDPREAYVETAIGYCDENGVKVAHGIVEGKISDRPRGENGFGYDQIFIPTGSAKTFSEMSDDEKDSVSMRARAVANLKEILGVQSGNPKTS